MNNPRAVDADADRCPNCHEPFEISAVSFNFLGQSMLLFVCPGCGLAKGETRDEARRKLRGRINVLEVLLRKLRS